MERLRKKLSEQESLLLLMSPSMAFRVHSRNGKVSASCGPDSPSCLPSPALMCLCNSCSSAQGIIPIRKDITAACHMSLEGTHPSNGALGL